MRLMMRPKRMLCRHQWQRSMFVALNAREAAIWCPRCGKHKH